ncbi:uncharacterized protein LOC126603661 isoform X3 [Malus sylvestris]|uniref:uncharacterized protein LOC126603661 isoform X3 n=1 Tax=Malus sylvestris TaxID=3752 RepID=UPI0021ACEE82|nr:uncharacterized protein LOC126603661 isoform X3 [Malus sylvestris]XP_050126539.1 uncharacterized protein LOC126603661 isoform X3 [Malus sylvestris]XP_050126540.1 uncharacterized protein LOC126603661 isoform X3 [Malus sylvestris]XP_050126541.1 uncharacterized protein LOC126603661 isoform X3 [Malus sylvestris]XP_050126542.1 uncharacterized protein LOC126603661 isoform X3 [Malus sylvestris]XP_050126543.1 uncharacterized protein LOC126603661 isoform X3 [Malus sylvestris]XP_050126544.1 uncharac
MQLKNFSLRELQVATDTFSDKNIIGRGGFGKVYRGRLADGTLVAVKRLTEERTQDGELQFQTEVEMIKMAVHHRNLLCLHGFCMTPTERLLVYPYMANGSVASCLRGRPEGQPALDWPIRQRIALGSARGLAYLHDHCDPKIIHRDVKAANILLDEEFEAVIGDFGLAKLMDYKDTYVTTHACGTFGHMAPEHFSTGVSSEKTDVFGYGVMLLELITGQRAFNPQLASDDDVMLVDWVKRLLKERRLERLVDADLNGNYIDDQVEQLIQVALLCTQGSPGERPKMSEVVRMLEGEGEGLAERWEERQNEEVICQDFNTIHHPSNTATGAIAGGVAVGAALTFAASANTLAYWRRRKPQDHFFDVPAEEDPEVLLGQLKRFSLRELQVATDTFSNKNILGRGGFGKVYKGRLADGTLVAVKRLKEERTQGGELQFQTEVEMISMAVHRNLLRLHGFCMTPTERLLVYPYMANGSVASCLRDRPEGQPALDWPIRQRIALESARGLAYLHDHCDPKIIHRDVKAANILLDEEFKAVVGDFGLAKLMDYRDTHVTTDVRGTIGHIAPEYLSTGKCSEKTDVFGYGVMLLELITGQRAFDLARLATNDDVMLLDWVKGLLKDQRLERLVDADLNGNYIDDQVEQLIQVALLCTQGSPGERPKMSEVVQMLEGEGEGLAERWEEWQNKEMIRQDFNTIHHPSNTATGAIAGGAAVGAALPFAAPAITLAYWRRRKPQDHFFDVPAEEDPEVLLGQLKRFSLRELQVATDTFSNKNILGRGGFGKVYKGRLADGTLVAVKRLKEERTQRGELQFQTEVEMISMAVHRNLLRLRGFCITRTERLLVYPCMANGSLASCLRDRPEGQPALDWRIRQRIALESARGLAYLHDRCDPKIIHRDVKAANILLDEEFKAVVGDFGLAILMDYRDTHVTTAVRGTIGHIAPEYLSTGKCSEKTDAFAYGVMLLELITGQRAFDLARLANDYDVMLLDWVKGLLKDRRLETLVDADLNGNYVYDQVEQLIQVALLCTQGTPGERPKMLEVVWMMEGRGFGWEEWQKEEVFHQDFNPIHHPSTNWITDSTSHIPLDELSGPR